MRWSPPMRARCLPLVLVAACSSGESNPAPDAPSAGRPDGVALCYSIAANESPAVTAFDAALRAGDRAVRADRIAALDAAAKAMPNEEKIHLYLGLAHLWRLAEPLPGEETPAMQAPSAIAARDHLEKAYELCPTDHRIAAWLGPVLVRFGRVLNDQATIDRGLAVLDKGIAHYPSFVLFSKLLVFADLAHDAPEFVKAVDAVFENVDACAVTPADPACTNATIPHNAEGAGLFLGDALAKGGKRAEAEAAYKAAAEGPAFASWSFQAELASRMSNLDDRIAKLRNSDPGDDPPVAWQSTTQCVVCHQQ